jgi:predicted dinucleotide-binding enzyme
MKIGILGTGEVGKALGTGFVSAGHEVKMGSRKAGNEKARAWAAGAGPRASEGDFAQAAKFGEVVVLATLGAAAQDVVRLAGPENLAGKVLIDATNPLEFPAGRPPQLFVGHGDSLGERVQKWAPKAKVVKAFNTVGNALMYKPALPGGPPDMFIGGDDEEAKKTVAGILTSFGWNTVDLGGIEASRYLEPMCLVWVLHGIRSGSWNHAFKLLHK